MEEEAKPPKPTGADWKAMGEGCQSLGCLLTMLGFGILFVVFVITLAAGGR